jgi:hypothetical protein
MRWRDLRKDKLDICMIQANHISSREDPAFLAAYRDRFHRYQGPATPGSAHRGRV